MATAAAEDIPSFDAVDGWPMPEAQAAGFGSPAIEETLIQAYRSGRMHHAWLFTGPRGAGKATLAFRFARYILANPDPSSADAHSLAVPPGDRTARQVAAGAHPNLLVLRRPWDDKTKRFRTELTVSEVRRIQLFFGSTAGEPGWRICIVDTADELNPSAANALLKMLEEPPQRSLFLLLSSRPGMLLPTIRSRCRRLDVPPLAAEAIEAALLETEPRADRGRLQLAARLSGGSLRSAIALLDGDGVELYGLFQRIVADLPRIDYRGVHELADRIGSRGDDDAYDAFLAGVEGWLWRRVRREPEPDGTAIPPAIAGVSLASWADVWEKVLVSSSDAEELNLDRRQIVLQAFMALADAARM